MTSEVNFYIQSQACNVQPCAAWGEFSFLECSKSCGGGTKIGIRQCEIVSGSGATCVGEAQTSESCNVESCDCESEFRLLNGEIQLADCPRQHQQQHHMREHDIFLFKLKKRLAGTPNVALN